MTEKAHDVATASVKAMNELSRLPPSFGNLQWLYVLALITLISLSTFGLFITRWMIAEMWRDRMLDHPSSLVFRFRGMMAMCGLACFMRCLPEVVYMTVHGDPSVSPEFEALVLLLKRAVDVASLPVMLGWMGTLCLIYPFIILAMRTPASRAAVTDLSANWPRMIKPIIMLGLTFFIATLMAIAKTHGQ